MITAANVVTEVTGVRRASRLSLIKNQIRVCCIIIFLKQVKEVRMIRVATVSLILLNMHKKTRSLNTQNDRLVASDMYEPVYNISDQKIITVVHMKK
jgi:hypothetical protein